MLPSTRTTIHTPHSSSFSSFPLFFFLFSFSSFTLAQSSTQQCFPLKSITTGNTLSGFSLGISLKNSSLVAWGDNSLNQLGAALGLNQLLPVLFDSPIFLGKKITQSSAGAGHSVVMTEAGGLFGWGSNTFGQIGDGSILSKGSPVSVYTQGALNGKTITMISCGAYHTMALSSDGHVFAWGQNTAGQVGDGSLLMATVPKLISIPGSRKVSVVVAGGYHSLALAVDGTLIAWGSNSDGQIGDGTTTGRNFPTLVSMNNFGASVVVKISAGTSHTAALDIYGNVYTWGQNTYGQLGDGTSTSKKVPTKLQNLQNVSQISCGSYHNLAVSGSLVISWGRNDNGQIGDGTSAGYDAIPVVVSAANFVGKQITSVTAGTASSFAVASDGSYFAWGGNSQGQLGDGTTVNRLLPLFFNCSDPSFMNDTNTTNTSYSPIPSPSSPSPASSSPSPSSSSSPSPVASLAPETSSSSIFCPLCPYGYTRIPSDSNSLAFLSDTNMENGISPSDEILVYPEIPISLKFPVSGTNVTIIFNGTTIDIFVDLNDPNSTKVPIITADCILFTKKTKIKIYVNISDSKKFQIPLIFTKNSSCPINSSQIEVSVNSENSECKSSLVQKNQEIFVAADCSDSKNFDPTIAIIASVVAAAIFVVVGGILVYYCSKKKNAKQKKIFSAFRKAAASDPQPSQSCPQAYTA